MDRFSYHRPRQRLWLFLLRWPRGNPQMAGRFHAAHLSGALRWPLRPGQRSGLDLALDTRHSPHEPLNRASELRVTQRIVSWGRSRDGSEFARGNRSVDTEGFYKSQMILNSGLRWLRALLRCFRWNGRNSVPGCPRGHPEATPRPCGSQPVGTLKPP